MNKVTQRSKNIIQWIERNPIDYELLRSIISQKALSIEQTTASYNIKYDNTHDKKLSEPMTKDILMQVIKTIEKHPNTFNNCNIRLMGNILHASEKKYTHLPELLEKIKNENLELIKHNKKLLLENINLLIKYEALRGGAL